MVRILSFTTLYPNAVQPGHGVFVENRLRRLVATGEVELRVMAPIPWFPFRGARFGQYGRFAQVPAAEERHGISVMHPRFPLLPKVGMTTAPYCLFVSARRAVRRLLDSGVGIDLIDAHYFYPDGAAAAMLGRHFRLPVTITARGSDLNLIPRYRVPRRLIQRAARDAAGLITVCQALKDVLVGLGVADERIEVLRNGVDLEVFRPVDRAAARAALGFERATLLAVGNLVALKGHDLMISALPDLPETDLVIVGDGPEREALARHAARLAVADRVRFEGRIAHESLSTYYTAADLLVLASSREGWPNVLLEAMACGTPVVASNVSGVPEIVTAPEAGVLLGERSARGIAEAVRAVLAAPPSRAATRSYAEGFDWEEPTQGQLALFRAIIAGNSRAA